jgi:hypothetical protein
MKLVNSGLTEWENRHENFKEPIKALFIAANDPDMNALDSYNDATQAIQQLISEQIQTDTPFRSLGAAWSFNKITTAKDGYMLDTKQLNTTMNISANSVLAKYKGDVKKLLFAQCGNGVWEISKQLRPLQLSLKTSGASNGQTIVGAMSTGAHGSSIDVGAVQDYVVGMHIILSPTRHIWLERKSAPIVKATFIKKLQTELVRDDELFNAALVSFGSFGFIHGVMIETTDIFLLETYMRKMPYDDALKKAMGSLDFSSLNLPGGNERPFHFAVSLNPYDLDNGAFVSTFYKRPYQEDYVRPVANAEGIGPGDDAPCFIGRITNAVPGLVPVLVTKLLGAVLKPYEKQFGTLAEIFNNTTLHGKLMSAAIGLPLNQVNKVTDILLELNKTKGPFAGLFAYRYIKKSKATLAFTRYEFTCILELDGAYSDATNNFYTAVWKKLDEENIPYTFHWGKVNELTPERIAKAYGNDAEAWIAARNKLLDEESLKVFTNPLLHEWGLDKVLL